MKKQWHMVISAVVLSILVMIILILTLFIIDRNDSHTKSIEGPRARAAIIDQMSVTKPNQPFIDLITCELKKGGFKEIQVFSGDEVNVDLFRNLPLYGFRLIIIRAHSGIVNQNPDDQTAIYTNEPYNQDKYLIEQFKEQLCANNVCFAISSSFISEASEGHFNKSTIITMGCDSLIKQDMAKAFISKGASVYFGWNGMVTSNFLDSATLTLVRNLCSDNLTAKEALIRTFEKDGVDPVYGSMPCFYPSESSGYTLSKTWN